MMAVNSGDHKRRRIASDEVVEYHELKTLQVAKTEAPDEQEHGAGSTSDHFLAQVDHLRGYDEETGGDDDSSVGTMNVEDEDSQYEISELRGLGPLDRRNSLNNAFIARIMLFAVYYWLYKEFKLMKFSSFQRLQENRCYNEGNWSSVELKALYDGITTTKVNEIRAINSEYAEDRIQSQSDQWLRTGYRNVCAIPQRVIPPEINNWEAAIHRVNRQIRSHNDCAISNSIKNALLDAPMDAENPTLYKVTHFRGAEGYGKEQAVSWQRLSEFFVGVIKHSRPLPPLNPLECAIALRMVDEVEDESARLLTDNEKAIIRGWLANIQMRDLRDFLPDLPYSVNSAARMLVDPLRTNSWGFTDSLRPPGSIPVDSTSSGNVEAQRT
ncbi:unnamed protein product [Angiostrongylus costaricensis]|uniref:Autophagy protein 5 n=1 Tax=Angiostrongylus costaricensis TaxID=334426 RepID=A0A158PDG2_ANGCS|nr:unnamed protein product [Angiostrongylus costaricensis]